MALFRFVGGTIVAASVFRCYWCGVYGFNRTTCTLSIRFFPNSEMPPGEK